MVNYLLIKLCDMTKDELRDFLHWFRNNKPIVHLMDNDMIITRYFIENPKLAPHKDPQDPRTIDPSTGKPIL